MPPNTPAIKFWKKVIADYAHNQFDESIITIQEPKLHDSNLFRFIAHEKRQTG